MDEARLKELVEEATAFTYDDEEAFWGLFSALIANLSFPLQAQAGGEAISISRLDGNDSGLPQGIICCADAGGQEKQLNLSEIELAGPDQTTAEWVAAYRYWMDNR
jgi:hypothetical protein